MKTEGASEARQIRDITIEALNEYLDRREFSEHAGFREDRLTYQVSYKGKKK